MRDFEQIYLSAHWLDKASLIDTGASPTESDALAKTILDLLPEKDHKKLPL